MSTRRIIAAACLCIVMGLEGCSRSGTTSGSRTAGTKVRPGVFPELPEDAPVIHVVRHGGNSQTSPAGLELAVWNDGFVLFAADRGKPAHSMRVGHIEQKTIETVLDELDDSGFFDMPAWCVSVPCGGDVSIRARHGGRRNSQGWDERPRPKYQEFETMWKAVIRAIEACRPADGKPAERAASPDGTVRGYQLDEPWQAPCRAPWLDSHLWYARP